MGTSSIRRAYSETMSNFRDRDRDRDRDRIFSFRSRSRSRSRSRKFLVFKSFTDTVFSHVPSGDFR
jgi:hypothetical protein